MAIELDPERCTLHCKNMNEWEANPAGFTQTEGGWKPNGEIAEKARQICPGVEVSITNREPKNFTENPDGTVTAAAGVIAFACQFFQADHGPWK